MLKNTKFIRSGFTLVELLIVIVVIAILAVISIVAYNGVQNRAKTSAAATAAETIQKKAEAANAVNSSYPATETPGLAAGTNTTDFESQADSSLKGSGITFAASFGSPAAAPSTPATIVYKPCTDAGTPGAQILYWDYTKSAVQTKTVGGTCSAYATNGLTSTGAL